MKLLIIQRKSHVASGVGFSRSVYARLLEPFDYLNEKGIIAYDVASEDICEPEKMNQIQFDVVVFSKHVSDVSLEIAREAKNLGKKIIYDIDDNLLNFPEYSGSNITDHRKENFYKHMTLADVVTVSTERLHASLSHHVDRAMVLVGNGFNVERHNKHAATTPSYKKIIYTNADRTKLHSFYGGFFKAINQFLKENSEMNLEIFSDYESELKQFSRYSYLGSVDWFEHKRRLAETGYFMGIVPLGGLEDSAELEFNSCKSPIKYLEYGGLKIAGIYSKNPIYTDVIEDRYNGLLVDNTEEAWLSALEELTKNKQLHKTIIENAYNDVKEKHHVSKSAKQWMEVINKIMES